MLVGAGPQGSAHLWEVYALSLALGVVNLFDNPARQTFVIEMVGKDDLANAVSLNSIVMNGARVIGPAIGGVLIATVGLGICFLFNAASYGAVLVALMLMRRADLHPAERVARAKGQLRAGVRYAWRTPNLRDPLMLVFVVGLLAYNFTVILPLLAQETFHGGAGTFALLTSLMAGGAVVGGLVVANRGRPNIHRLTGVGIAFSVMIAGVAVSPSLAVAGIVIVFMGALSIAFIATANSTIQLQVEPTMRGRVMALYAMGFLGTTPIGAPLVGWISQTSSPRVALLVGAGATLVASTVTMVRHRNAHRARRDAGPDRGRGRARRRARGGLSLLRRSPPRRSAQAGEGRGSLGSPRTRSPTMLRWISAVPPQIVSERLKKNEAWRSPTG